MATPPDDDRDPIDLMAESFLARFRRGERPSIDEYAAKYPDLADEIRELLPALVQLESDLSVGGATGTFDGGARVATLKGAPRRLGDYTILREVGRGGMGVVYEAVQQSLGRHVALKVLPWQELGDSSQLERFALEARSAARLHHSNIVPVFGVGEHDGTHFYAMQFIRGQGLDQVIAELRRLRQLPEPTSERTGFAPPPATVAATVAHGLMTGRFDAQTTAGDGAPAGPATSATHAAGTSSSSSSTASALIHAPESHHASERQYYRQVARIGLQVAEALAYAHGQGILHRDIKPSNLLVDTQGTVWITDFGLAKAEGSEGPTKTGDIVGTLRYMGPERFEGRSDPRSDVYALGATLYELLALEPVFGEANRARLIERILHDPPAPPRKFDRHVPRDLETIVLKALAKEPSQRYPDAEAMAEDLRRVIEDRPIRARRIGTTEQVWRWCRRRPAVAGLLGLLLLLLVGGTVAASLAAHHFRNLAKSEAEARRQADRLAGLEREATALAARRAAEAEQARAAADLRAKEAQEVTNFLINDLLGAARPGRGQGPEMTVAEALARADATIAGRFAGQPLLEAAIRYRMGETYWDLGLFPKAEAHFRVAAALRRRVLGPDDPETLATEGWLFATLRWTDRTAEARDLARSVLERRRRVLGPEHPDTLSLMVEAGALLGSGGVDHYGPIYQTLLRTLGPRDVRTLGAMHGYAVACRDLALYDRAEALLREELAIRVAAAGEAERGANWARHDLIETLVKARKFDEAWRLAGPHWHLAALGFDPAAKDLAYETDLVIQIPIGSGDWGPAAAFFRDESAALARHFGAGDPRAPLARALLARALAGEGRPSEAVAVAQEALVALGRGDGPTHRAALDQAVAALGRAGVPGLPRDPLGAADSGPGLGAGGGSGAVDRLALALLEASHPDAAATTYREAIRARPDDPIARARLGFILAWSGDRPGATTAYREAARLAPQDRGVDETLLLRLARQGPWLHDPSLAVLLSHEPPPPGTEFVPALMALALGRDREAHRRACLALLAKAREKGDPGNAFQAARACALAPDPVADWAVVVDLARRGADDREHPWPSYGLGLALYRAGRYEEAIRSLLRSIEIDPRWQGAALNWPVLAMAHHRLGHADEARVWLDRAEAAPRWGSMSELFAWDDMELWWTAREARALIRGASAEDDAPDPVIDPVRTAEFATRLGRLGEVAAALEGLASTDPRVALTKNNAAWALVADRAATPEAVALGLRLARGSVAAGPTVENRNTLGVALYRAGQFEAAVAELETSVRLDSKGRSFAFNGFFLAMAHGRLGHPVRAFGLLDRSLAWMKDHAPDNPELRRIRSEAEAVVRLDPLFPADPFAR